MLDVRALLLILAAGCYTQSVYSLSPHEQCALNAMVLDGGETGGLYGASSRQAPGETGGLYGASMRSDGQDMRCRRPATPAEQCEIRSMQASAQLKHQSNAGDVAPVSNDQVDYVRSSTYQSCMAGSVSGPPGSRPPAPQ
ncbi:MAG TPA: hypothetical protein VH143_30890 [Kofleriaceae bacterium]|jgi:hypothetical protein|nr:hypothetical protein [Kofleriaceae bacterium]